MSLYEQFVDEASFRRDFIKPLLNKLGFSLVTDFHGRREFGKDFVFSELNRFGGVRHYAAQIKHIKTIGLGNIVDDLYTQTNQAFSNPFTLPDFQSDTYISSFYIFNSGSITTEAKDDLIQRLRRVPYGENVYFLDGERLDSLNKWATYQIDVDLRGRLSGLKNQLIINIKIWKSVIEDANKETFQEARGSILAGIETFLSSPIFPEQISANDLMQLWQYARIINSISSRYLLNFIIKPDIKKQDTQQVKELAEKAISCAIKMISEIDKIIPKLKPL